MFLFKTGRVKMPTLLYSIACDKCKRKAVYKIDEGYYCKRHALEQFEKFKLNYPLYR